MKTPRQSLGQWGEALAARHLIGQGYTILDRNVRTPYGEIDLVVCHITRGCPATVFVEVKTRASANLGLPEISITPRKQAHLLNAAQYYLQNHPELEGDWRVDAIAIRRYPDHPPEIVHFENVLT